MEHSDGSVQNCDRQRIIDEKNLIRQKIRCSLKKEKEARTTLSELLSQLELAEREKNRLLQDRLELETRGNVIQQKNSNHVSAIDTSSLTKNDVRKYPKMLSITESKISRRNTTERKANVATERQSGSSCRESRYLSSTLDPKIFLNEETNQSLKIIQENLATVKSSDTIAKCHKNRMSFNGKNRNLLFDRAVDLKLAIAERLALNKRCNEIKSPVECSAPTETALDSLPDSWMEQTDALASFSAPASKCIVLEKSPVLQIVNSRGNSRLTRRQTHLSDSIGSTSTKIVCEQPIRLEDYASRQASHSLSTFRALAANFDASSSRSALGPLQSAERMKKCKKNEQVRGFTSTSAVPFDKDFLSHRSAAPKDVDALACEGSSIQSSTTTHRQGQGLIAGQDVVHGIGNGNGGQIGHGLDINELLASLNGTADRLLECLSDAQDLRQSLRRK